MYIYLVLNQKKIFPLDWRATSATQQLTLTRPSQTYIDNPTTVVIYFLKKDSKPPVKFSKVSIKKKKIPILSFGNFITRSARKSHKHIEKRIQKQTRIMTD